MTVTEYLDTLPRNVLIILGVLLAVLVAGGDYAGHADRVLDFSPFYLVPVSYFTWFLGRRPGFMVALASTGAGFFIRSRSAQYSVAYWDALVWFVLYIVSTLLVSQLKAMYQREHHLSRIDPLTRIENRRAFLEAAARIKSLSDRHDLPVSLAYIDLDGFKQLNDRWGHVAGDRLLAMTAAGLRKAFRPSDVVARIGGDEFAVILPATDRNSAGLVLRRVRSELEQIMVNLDWPVTASIGLVSFDPPLPPVDEMLRAADRAMYGVKSAGRKRSQGIISRRPKIRRTITGCSEIHPTLGPGMLASSKRLESLPPELRW